VLSGHALNAEDEQRPLNASLIVLVVMLLELAPGANGAVAVVIGFVHAEKEVSLLKLVK